MSAEPESTTDPSPNGLVSRSHLGIEPFELRRPASVADAATAVADGAWAHAGGIDVAQRLRAGEVADEIVPLCTPRSSADVGLERLGEISLGERCLFIGAGVTHARIESDPLVQAHRPDVAAAWRTIGNVRIRAAGTLGGNLAAFHPGYDAAPILAAAGAEIVVAEADGTERRCPVADVPRNRLIIGCEVPLDGRVIYDRSLKPVVSVAVGDQAIAVGCAYAQTHVIPHGAASPEQVSEALTQLPAPNGDAFASAGYRRRMIDVLVGRCLRAHASSAAHDANEDVRAGAMPADTATAAPTPTASRSGGDGGGTSRAAGQSDGDSHRDGAGDAALVEMHLNGGLFAAAVPPSEMLVDTIRTRAGLGATRIGCDQAVCGACTVLVDGVPTASCSTFSWQIEGRGVVTIEAAGTSETADAPDDVMSALPATQAAFAEHSAFQCGYCTPGLILVAAALLARDPDPDRATICDWIDSNVCRCTGYLMVIEAVEAAAGMLGRSPDGTAGAATRSPAGLDCSPEPLS